jgi:hypothetical protein
MRQIHAARLVPIFQMLDQNNVHHFLIKIPDDQVLLMVVYLMMNDVRICGLD